MSSFHKTLVWAGGLCASVIAIAMFVGLSRFPPFDRPSMKGRIGRTRSDLRSLATGIESYFIDHKAYPAWTLDGKQSALQHPAARGPLEHPARGQPAPSFRLRGATELSTLTTPNAYLTSMFADVFAEFRGDSFAYFSPGDATKGWILFSPGPDCVFDLPWEIYDPSKPQPSAELLSYSYDPTNGTVSSGDVWRVKQ